MVDLVFVTTSEFSMETWNRDPILLHRYALIGNNWSIKFGVEYWALPGSNWPWRPWVNGNVGAKPQLFGLRQKLTN